MVGGLFAIVVVVVDDSVSMIVTVARVDCQFA